MLSVEEDVDLEAWLNYEMEKPCEMFYRTGVCENPASYYGIFKPEAQPCPYVRPGSIRYFCERCWSVGKNKKYSICATSYVSFDHEEHLYVLTYFERIK